MSICSSLSHNLLKFEDILKIKFQTHHDAIGNLSVYFQLKPLFNDYAMSL